MMRKDDPGWEPIAVTDGRRGLWIRVTESEGAARSVELCSGREGDDGYVSFHVGERVTLSTLHDLTNVLGDLRFAFDTAKGDDDGSA